MNILKSYDYNIDYKSAVTNSNNAKLQYCIHEIELTGLHNLYLSR
jgi:hypothetical protein